MPRRKPKTNNQALNDLIGLTEEVLTEVRKLNTTLVKGLGNMAGELDRLASQVQANTDAEQSAITLLGQLSELIRASAGNPAAITALADQLSASKEALAAAVVQNTPAAPASE